MAQKKSLRCSFKSHQRAGWHHDYYHWTLGPHSGAGLAHFSRREDIWECHGVPRPQRLVGGGAAWQGRPSRALSSCEVVSRGILCNAGWLLNADMFSFELFRKRWNHWNVELGKDSRCPSYISCLGTFWKVLEKKKKQEYSSNFAHSHLRCFYWDPSSFPSWTLTARPEVIQRAIDPPPPEVTLGKAGGRGKPHTSRRKMHVSFTSYLTFHRLLARHGYVLERPMWGLVPYLWSFSVVFST